ncbi:hypothetical protein Lal_00048419 [Lupinus albus]|nr:hypothetical protein Lal_00048419 [Lupinus albus]
MATNIKAHENRKQIFSKNAASRENPFQHQPKPATEPPHDITELSGIFTNLATMVAHQGELAIRSDSRYEP